MGVETDSGPGDAGMDSGFDAGPPDTGVPDSGVILSCGEIITCTQACDGNANCIARCDSEGTATAQALFQSVEICVDAACPGLDGGGCDGTQTACQTCQMTAMNQSCLSQVVTCQLDQSNEAMDAGADAGDGGPMPDGGDGGEIDSGPMTPDSGPTPDAGEGLSCGGALTCVQTCAPQDPNCPGACLADSTASARNLFATLITCLVDTCSGADGGNCASSDAGCGPCQTAALTGACSTSAAACDADSSGRPFGDAGPEDAGPGFINDAGGVPQSCSFLIECANTCAPGDQACLQACSTEGTTHARLLFSSLEGCLSSACPSADGGVCQTESGDCTICYTAAGESGCQPYAVACVQDRSGQIQPDAGPSGDAGPVDAGPPPVGCSSVLACAGLCAAGDATCAAACASTGTPVAQIIFDSLETCIGSACPMADGGVCATEGSACDTCATGAMANACAQETLVCQQDMSANPDGGTDGGSCVPITDAIICSELHATCGNFDLTDNCGLARSPNCGTCESSATCDPAVHQCICPTGQSMQNNGCITGIGQSCSGPGATCPSGQQCVQVFGIHLCDIVNCQVDADCGTNGTVPNVCQRSGPHGQCQPGCDPAVANPCPGNSNLVCSTVGLTGGLGLCQVNCNDGIGICNSQYGATCDAPSGQCITTPCTSNADCGSGKLCFTDTSTSPASQICVPDCRNNGGFCPNSGACDPSTGTCDLPVSGPLAGAACDPMVPAECGFPFPSNVWLSYSTTTATSAQVLFLTNTLPLNTNTMQHINPVPWSDSDGFSPGATIMTDLPGATTTGLPTQDTLATSTLTSSPTIVLDTSTGMLVPHFAEIDVTGRPGQQALLIHPVVRLKDATRYIVAIRHVADGTGTIIAPSAVFQALRDGTASSDPSVAARRGLYGDILGQLGAAGIATSDLQVAWDFTTASEQNDTSQLVSMKSSAFAALPSSGPQYTATAVDNPDGAGGLITRRITGTIHIPLFLDNAGVIVDADPQVVDLNTGFILQQDAFGNPQQNGFADFEYVVEIPTTVASAGRPAPVLIQGHDLFSDRTEGQIATSTTDNFLLQFASNYKYVTMAVDLIGWRTPGSGTDTNQENDQIKLAGFAAADIGYFRRMVDRGTQGLLNELVAAHLMTTAFAQDPNVLYTAGSPDPAHGTSVIDPTRVYYRGDGQGGALGITFLALSPDVTLGYLGEAGLPATFILPRSDSFASAGAGSSFLQILQAAYPTSSEDVQLVLGLMQMHWDRLEGNGFTNGIVNGAPARTVLINDAIGDFEVTPLASHILARTLAAGNLSPVVRDVFGLSDVSSRSSSNALVEFDFGVENISTVTIPETDLPPTDGSGTGRDPHQKLRSLIQVQQEMDAFFRTGGASNPCSGVDASNTCSFGP
jgi:hypothetical protein